MYDVVTVGEDKWNPADIIAIRASQASSIINELANFNPARRNAQSRKLQEENARLLRSEEEQVTLILDLESQLERLISEIGRLKSSSQ